MLYYFCPMTRQWFYLCDPRNPYYGQSIDALALANLMHNRGLGHPCTA
ncbi:hypothetical protein [Halioglobus sp. HI00S01]|nr:hypothetical protein [Halioglobus sp. HI00S01]